MFMNTSSCSCTVHVHKFMNSVHEHLSSWTAISCSCIVVHEQPFNVHAQFMNKNPVQELNSVHELLRSCLCSWTVLEPCIKLIPKRRPPSISWTQVQCSWTKTKKKQKKMYKFKKKILPLKKVISVYPTKLPTYKISNRSRNHRPVVKAIVKKSDTTDPILYLSLRNHLFCTCALKER